MMIGFGCAIQSESFMYPITVVTAKECTPH